MTRFAESVGETMAGVMGLSGTGELEYAMSTVTEEYMQQSKKDLTTRIQSRRAMSLRRIGERHPSETKGLDPSTPLNAIEVNAEGEDVDSF